MQREILANYPEANVRVYAVWFDMFPGDARAQWPADLLTDPRVTHRWDEGKVVGTFFGKNKSKIQPHLSPDSNGMGGDILWDAYLLYGANARWNDFPEGLEHLGRTIVAGRETLKKDFDDCSALPRSKHEARRAHAGVDARAHRDVLHTRRPTSALDSESCGLVGGAGRT